MKTRTALAGASIAALIAAGGVGYGYSDPSSLALGPLTSILGALVLGHVPSNASLANLPARLGRVRRDGFATPGDGGAADYTTQAGACPLNGGAGDGGSQVGLGTPGAWVGCAMLDWASVGYVAPLPVFGSKCTGFGGADAAADTAAAIAAAATTHNVYMPGNLVNTNQFCTFTQPILLMYQGQKFFGDGPQASKIQVYTVWGGNAGSFVGSISGNILTVASVSPGTVLAVNAVITGLVNGGNNVQNASSSTPIYITNLGTGSGGVGNYILSGTGSYSSNSSATSTTVGSESMLSSPIGVITLTKPGQEVRSLQISFDQSNQSPTQRSDLTSYQPGIMARNAGNLLDDLLIIGGSTCIDAGGNTNAGNSKYSTIGTGCYDYGIRLDGAVAPVSIEDHIHYPYQMSAAQDAVFQRPANIAIDLGRMDDYVIKGGLAQGTTAINLYTGTQGSAFGTATGYDFDGAAVGIHMTSPYAALDGSALSFSIGTSAQHPIIQTAGRLTIAASAFFMATASVVDQFTGGVQTISGSLWNGNNFDAAMISANCSGNANAPALVGLAAQPCRLTLASNTVERDPGTAFNNPWLSSTGNEIVTAMGNSVTPTTQTLSGGALPPFISIANDTLGNRVIGNSSPGWENYVASGMMPDSLSLTQGGGKYIGN